jgi:hypothetical protein
VYAVPIQIPHHGKYVAKLNCENVLDSWYLTRPIGLRVSTYLEPEARMVDVVPLRCVSEQSPNNNKRAIGQFVGTMVFAGTHSSQREKYALFDIRQAWYS